MTIQLQKTVTETREIPVPCFWKVGQFVYGLIDELNLYQILLLDNYHTILNCIPEDNKGVLGTYIDDKAEIITKEQFFSAYSEAREATELTPVLTEPAHRDQAEQYRKTVNW